MNVSCPCLRLTSTWTALRFSRRFLRIPFPRRKKLLISASGCASPADATSASALSTNVPYSGAERRSANVPHSPPMSQSRALYPKFRSACRSAHIDIASFVRGNRSTGPGPGAHAHGSTATVSLLSVWSWTHDKEEDGRDVCVCVCL